MSSGRSAAVCMVARKPTYLVSCSVYKHAKSSSDAELSSPSNL